MTSAQERIADVLTVLRDQRDELARLQDDLPDDLGRAIHMARLDLDGVRRRVERVRMHLDHGGGS